LKFLLVGGLGFLVDAGIVAWLITLGVSPIVARVPSLATAILTTWLLNRSLTFRVASRPHLAELVRYAAVALTTAGLNFLLYTFLLHLGVKPVLAIALATLGLMFVSFSGYRLFAFRLRPQD
jgi:putative flippase GtrA